MIIGALVALFGARCDCTTIVTPSCAGVNGRQRFIIFTSNNSFNHRFTRNDTAKSQRGKSGEMLKRENASRKRESTKTQKGMCLLRSCGPADGARSVLATKLWDWRTAHGVCLLQCLHCDRSR